MKIFGTQRARPDLSQVVSYLSERNPAVADNFIPAIDLSTLLGSRLSAVSQAACPREFALSWLEPILIFIESAGISILRMIEGRMDVDEEFQR